MKKIFGLLALVSVFWASGFKVSRIEVYPGGARVYLHGNLGEDGKLVLAPLPRDISEVFSTHPDFTIKEFVNKRLPVRALQAKNKYLKYKSELEKLEQRIRVLKNRENFYKSALENLAKGFSRRTLPGWGRLLDDFSSKIAELEKKIALLEKKREELIPELKMAEEDWEEIRPSVERAKMAVVKGRPGDKVEFSFNTSSISMGVFYRVEASLSSSQVELKGYCRLNSKLPADLSAEVYLLPAKPAFYLSLPHQGRWDLTLWKPYPKRRLRTLAAAPAPLYEASRAAPVKPRSVGLYRTVFLGKREVKFGENRFSLFAEKLEGEITWEAYPALSSRVFVTFRGKNTTGFHLPAAQALFFIDGALSRVDELDSVALNQPLKLLLGEDPNFKVKYRKKVVERNRGIMKSGMVLEREVELRNGGEKERTVLIKLPLPYPVDREIKVQDRISPPPASLSKDRIATWKLRIKPRELKKIILSFKIIYPKGKRISGADRF